MTIGSPNPALENGENPDFKVKRDFAWIRWQDVHRLLIYKRGIDDIDFERVQGYRSGIAPSQWSGTQHGKEDTQEQSSFIIVW